EEGNEFFLVTGGWKGSNSDDACCGIKIKRFGQRAGPHFAAPFELIRDDYDIVICDLGHAVPWISPIILRKKHLVHFVHLHARSLPGQVGRTLAMIIASIERLYFIIYARSKFVTISETSKKDLIKLGIKEDRITIINPGVNRELFKPSEKTPYPSIVYFGGFRPYKRPEESLYLLNDIKKKFPEAVLYIVGEGPSRHYLEKLVSDMNLKDNVILTGRLTDEKLAEIVAKAWLNVHTSVTEGWGISIIEAASAGTPTVAYDVPGVSNSIENYRNGLKVKDGDRKALLDAAIKIIEEHERWSLNSLEFSKKYSWDKAYELWKKIIFSN
ncbi:MAG: glycosyltransferase family 4 protein, partial [Thermoplasmata archaeon]